MMKIVQIPVLNDNYIYIIHDLKVQKTICVDPALAEPVLECLLKNQWSLDYIINTHHHHDHVGGNSELKKETNCQIIGSLYDQNRIPDIDKTVCDGDILRMVSEPIQIIETPGHTLGHIVCYFQDSHLLFCGDTLFSLGCGRLFEGTASQMWSSLKKIRALAPQTQIYCTHEYTLANMYFARIIDPDNLSLKKKSVEVQALRKRGLSTIPTLLKDERAANPFLRADCQDLKDAMAMREADDIDVFAALRSQKDVFS